MLSTTKNRGRSRISAARALSLALFACLAALLSTAGFAQERVTLDAQRHDGFGRLIVTFPDRMNLPAHAVTSDNGVLVIAMDEVQLAGELPDVGQVLSDYLGVARFDPDMGGIRMGLRGPFALNTIVAGEQLYIDLLPQGWVGLPPSLPAEVIEKLAQRAEDAARIAEERRRAEMVAEYDPQATIQVGTHPTFSRVLFEWNVGTRAEFNQDGDSAVLSFDWPVPIALHELIGNLPPQIERVENRVTPGSSEIVFHLAEDVPLRFYAADLARFVLDVNDPHAPREGIDLSGVAELAQFDEGADAGPEPEGEPETVAPVEAIMPEVSSVGSTVRVVFPFPTETASAVFRRGDTVWMVFDTTIPIRAPEGERADMLSAIAEDFSIQPAGAAQVVRMTLDSNRLATMGAEGRAWVLSLGDTLLNATEPVSFDRRRDVAGNFEMLADVARPGAVHQLRDPDVGDVLDIVTVFPPARGTIRDLAYVDFLAQRSIHGLVIKPLHGGVSVAIEEANAIISSPTGLVLSDAQPVRYRMLDNPSASALQMGAWQVTNPHQFTQRRNELVARTATVEGRELDRARLELAQFYLGNGFAQEAMGVIEVMRPQLHQPVLEPQMNAAYAAASALAGRTEEALAILNGDEMRHEPDAMMWRTIARVEAGRDYGPARLDALGAGAVVDDYPAWVRSRFQLAAIRAALMERDADMAAGLLNSVELSLLTRDQVAQYELLGGMLDQLNGRGEEALESFGRVIVADRRPTTAEAVLRTIEVLDSLGRLDLGRAVDTLSVQATLWRGGPLELEMAVTLADLMYRNGDYRDGFVMARNISETHGDSPVLDRLVDRARIEFAGLYLDGGADALEPIEALSLYYDYRHLTAPGSDGDLMIRNLAYRLIKADLLGQAAELLQYQVDHRLEGAARAQVATDLAVVYIAGHDSGAALRVLGETRLAGLPPGLERQRRVLEASALINLGRQDLALDMIANLAGRDVELLRIDALWRAGRHRQASELIETLYSADADRGTLSQMARANVIKAAVGYLMAGDAIGMARLRSRFSDAMANAPEWPMFALVTEEMDISAPGIRDVVRQVASTDAINAFLNAYREIYARDDALIPMRTAPLADERVASL